ncbi:ASCH domain-containing protein [Streptococcus plurextorum]|uniref:ASCH domain-containing protein n=1 Tax=Streptococcus plurextorum TaxID=456876 RepID=UPI0003FC9E09|nr:ASCH domain-containing protein [Streptococcus plurextorum]
MAKYGELQAKYPDLEVWGHPAEYADLYDLTVSGHKRATSSWFAEYVDLEDLDKPGNRSIMLDNPEHPTQEVLLVTDKVVLERFKDISPETARANGEGDGSVADWQRIFGDFWKRHLPTVGLTFSEDGVVVTEFFHVEEV